MYANSLYQNNRLTNRVLRIYFLAGALQGGVVLKSLLNIPTDAKNRFLFGFSLLRLGTILGVLLVTLVFFWLIVETWRHPPGFIGLVKFVESQLRRQSVWAATVFLAAFVLLSGGYLLLLTPEIKEPFAQAYFERLSPLILWMTLLSAQTLLALPLLRHGASLSHYLPKSSTFRWTFIIFGSFLILWGWIAWSRTGLDPDIAGWNALGAPILETQVFLAWSIGMILLAISAWWERRSKSHLPGAIRGNPPSKKLDLLICLLLWLAGSFYWWSIPLPSSWFVTEPTTPNYDYYPNSDALIYDTTGQSMLVGERFKSWDLPFPRRPMYALFLAFLDTIGHQKYSSIVSFQVVVLALFPVVLYLLTQKLSTRLAGIAVAILAILREGNAIRLSGNYTFSHSKLLMSDLPTALGVALVAYLIVSWLQNPDSRQLLPLMSGGVLGFFMLIRPEVAILLLVVLLVSGVQWFRRLKYLSKNVFLIFAGITLALSPWIFRNWQMTGKIFLDAPDFRIDFFIEQINSSSVRPSTNDQNTYALVANKNRIKSKPLSGVPDETILPDSGSNPLFQDGTNLSNSAMSTQVLKSVGEIPASIAEFIQSHYLHSQIQSVLYLPTTLRLPDSLIGYLGHHSLPKFLEECCSARNYTRRLPYWNQNWQGEIPKQSIIPVLLNLFLIATGLRIAWEKNRLTGLVPLGFSIAYFLINAVARTSGGRYIMAVDWIPMMYFAIGLGHISLEGTAFISRTIAPVDAELQPKDGTRPMRNEKSPRPAIRYLAISIGFIFLGSLLPITEKAVPPRYTQPVKQEVLASLLASRGLGDFDQSDLDSFIKSNGKVLIGRALYPRYFESDEGAPGKPTTDRWAESAKPSFYPKDFSRLSFYLVGPENSSVLLPIEKGPDHFPNASDVIILGCQGEEYFDAWVVARFDPQHSIEAVFTRFPELEESACPFPDSQ